MNELGRLRLENSTADRVGDRILSLVREVVSTIIGNYPDRYFLGHDRRSDLEDVVIEVFTDFLLPNETLERLLAAAKSTDDFRGMVGALVKRALRARMLEKTIVDDLLGRCRRYLRESDAFVVEGRGFGAVYWRVGSDPEPGRPTSAQIRRLALELTGLPRVKRGIYSRRTIIGLLGRLTDDTNRFVGIRDIEEILRTLLTPWLSPTLVPGAEMATEPSHEEGDPGVVVSTKLSTPAVAQAAATAVVADLSLTRRSMFALLLAGTSKTEIADLMSTSRQTVYNNLVAVEGIVQRHLVDLEQSEQDAAMEYIRGLLAASP